MTVIVPADCSECAQAIEFAAAHKGPVYIRIARNNLPDVYPEDYKFIPNKAQVLKEGNDLTIVSNGDVLAEAYKAAQIFETKGISAEVISLPVVKPLDGSTIVESAKKTGFVVTVENHSIYGGIGSAISEVLSEVYPTKVLRIGVNDTFGQSGTPKELLSYYGLDAESIVKRVIEAK